VTDFRVRLSTGLWDVVLTKAHGVTTYQRSMVIAQSRESRDRLDTFIHETLHASAKDLPEAEVARIAADIAAVLWRAGYRKHQQRKKL